MARCRRYKPGGVRVQGPQFSTTTKGSQMSGDGSNMSGDELTGRPSGDVVALPPGWTASPLRVPVPICGVELREYLYASALLTSGRGPLLESVREVLRLHRFDVMSWLLQNGVAIPAALLDDRLHAEVGNQMPDKPTDRG